MKNNARMVVRGSDQLIGTNESRELQGLRQATIVSKHSFRLECWWLGGVSGGISGDGGYYVKGWV